MALGLSYIVLFLLLLFSTLAEMAICLACDNLFSPLGKLAGRAIYFDCVNVFLFLMTARRTIISGSTGPIFAIFSLNDSVLGADDRSGPLFPISQEKLPWQPILWKNGKLPHLSLWHSKTEWDIATPICTLTA